MRWSFFSNKPQTILFIMLLVSRKQSFKNTSNSARAKSTKHGAIFPILMNVCQFISLSSFLFLFTNPQQCKCSVMMFSECAKQKTKARRRFLSSAQIYSSAQTRRNTTRVLLSWAERAKTGRRWARSNCIISNKGSKIFITKRSS